MADWHAYTPDGRKLYVRRDGESWIVRCDGKQAQSKILDVALIEAIRSDADVAAHAHGIDYPAWVRKLADEIEKRPGQE